MSTMGQQYRFNSFSPMAAPFPNSFSNSFPNSFPNYSPTSGAQSWQEPSSLHPAAATAAAAAGKMTDMLVNDLQVRIEALTAS